MTRNPDDLRSFERPSSPNTAFYAPSGVDVASEPDGVVPVYPVAASELSALASKLWNSLKHVALKELQENGRITAHFVATTPILRFKDDITVEFVEMGAGQSSFLIYSASRVGYSDFGTNRKRVEDWLFRLNEAVRGA